MAQTFTVVETITWTPPKAANNSAVSTLGVTGTYNSQSVGSIDVPSGTTVDTVIGVPFGQVDAVKSITIRNEMSTDIAIQINGSGTDDVGLASGGEFKVECPTSPTTAPITQLDVVTKADPAATEYIHFFVFGD